MNIIIQLDRLAYMQAQQDVIKLHYSDLREAILTPEIQKAFLDIAAEEQSSLDAIYQEIKQLSAEIKTNVLEVGVTHKGKFLQAVYSKPHVSWDTKALDGYAAGHPEILPFRKEGEPSVSIRKI